MTPRCSAKSYVDPGAPAPPPTPPPRGMAAPRRQPLQQVAQRPRPRQRVLAHPAPHARQRRLRLDRQLGPDDFHGHHVKRVQRHALRAQHRHQPARHAPPPPQPPPHFLPPPPPPPATPPPA